MKLEDFPHEAGKVQGKQIKYYLIWISKYNTYSKRYKQNSDQDYLESLSEKHQDRQLQHKSRHLLLFYIFLEMCCLKKLKI